MHVTNEEIIAVAEGAADRQTERRVLAAALRHPEVRRRLIDLRAVDSAPMGLRELEGDFAERAGRLREAMYRTAREVRRETGALQPGLWRGTVSSLARWTRRTIAPPRRTLALPCLAPAQAAASESMEVLAKTLEVDGIIIELQQLPGMPARLRLLVDGREGDVAGADAVALTFDGIGTCIVPLDAEGAGWLDLRVSAGGSAERDSLTVATDTPVVLTSVALLQSNEDLRE